MLIASLQEAHPTALERRNSLPGQGKLPACPPAHLPAYHGAEGDRTPDLCSAIAALSQLSYSPGKAG
jgi:hypothetical protein